MMTWARLHGLPMPRVQPLFGSHVRIIKSTGDSLIGFPPNKCLHYQKISTKAKGNTLSVQQRITMGKKAINPLSTSEKFRNKYIKFIQFMSLFWWPLPNFRIRDLMNNPKIYWQSSRRKRKQWNILC